MKHQMITLFTLLLTQSLYASEICHDDGQQKGDHLLTPVSKAAPHKIRGDEVLNDLATIPQEFVLGGKQQLRAEALQALVAMFNEAKAAGVILKVYSSHRDFKSQCSAFRGKYDKLKIKPEHSRKSKEELIKYVENISAVAGRSEHQLGTTVDIVYPSLNYKLTYPDIQNRCAGNLCAEYQWLLQHAHRFGFSLSYPRFGLSDFNPVTEYNFEPWHWRYVGVSAAEEIFNLSAMKTVQRRVSIIEYIRLINNEISMKDLERPQSRNPSSEIQELVIGMGGDVSLSRPGTEKLDPHGSEFGKFYNWDEMTKDLEKMTKGNDFNFLNLESVVSDKALKVIEGKKWPQKSHPKGVEHLVTKAGFNLISLANNHAYDYDDAGLLETLSHLQQIKNQSRAYVSGLGLLKETLNPEVIEWNGLRIAFLAVGMKGDDRPQWENSWRPTDDKPGMLSVRHCAQDKIEKPMQPCAAYGDLRLALQNLKATPADLRIVSIHEGMELSVHIKNGAKPDDDALETKDKKQRQRSENRNIEAKFNLIKSYGVDLILGHHSHNVRPVEISGKTLAFYGLGNLLFLGGKNYSSNDFPLWNQYGLFAKSFYSLLNGKLTLAAIQVIPLKNSHIAPTFWEPTKASQFIDYLNAASVKSLGDRAVQFKSRPDGTAVFCVPSAAKGARAKAICL